MEGLMSYLPLLLLLGVMYFVVMRPQQQQQKKRQAMLNELRAGIEVVTIGGLHGTITSMDDRTVTLKVASDVELTFDRAAIRHVKEGQN